MHTLHIPHISQTHIHTQMPQTRITTHPCSLHTPHTCTHTNITQIHFKHIHIYAHIQNITHIYAAYTFYTHHTHAHTQMPHKYSNTYHTYTHAAYTYHTCITHICTHKCIPHKYMQPIHPTHTNMHTNATQTHTCSLYKRHGSRMGLVGKGD